ncbi:MAG: hypothetical protein WDZ64_00800 [Parcubacteria group bacterium]
MNEQNKLIQQYFEKLPKNYQEVITNSKWELDVQKISLSNNIDSNKIDDLKIEVKLVLYGIEDAEDFIENIIREVQLTNTEAVTISQAINDEIFKPIMVKAKELENQSFTPEQKLSNTPIKEIKEEAKKQLIDKREQTGQKASIPEIAPEIHPMVEEGETAHTVPHVEQSTPKTSTTPNPTPIPNTTPPTPPSPPTSSTPNPIPKPETPKESFKPEKKPDNTPAPPPTHYPQGQDPYREPLE